MEKIFFTVTIALLVVCAILLIIILSKGRCAGGDFTDVGRDVEKMSKSTDEKIDKLTQQMRLLTDKNYEQQIKLIETLNANTQNQTQAVAGAVEQLQKSNEQKLEQMRKTVDEKLDESLGRRLNDSFNAVSQQLASVYKSLGEMKELSAGVTTSVSGLNRVLTNVKSRGTWAEVQLSNILDQTIPNMYETNVQTNPTYNGRVEFAVKIPGSDGEKPLYLPIDSKFPMEDYVRLSALSEAGDADGAQAARKALEARIRDEAKLIRHYINPPDTTPFAVMYLATEGLYAEITASKSAIAEKIQADGILIAGPSTITALLNSLAMGFKTIAVNEKANEVRLLLAAAKTQYEKFGTLLAKAHKKIDEAGKALDEAEHRNNIIQKSFKNIEEIDDSQSGEILGLE